jgi:hypothetical protein
MRQQLKIPSDLEESRDVSALTEKFSIQVVESRDVGINSNKYFTFSP